MDQFSLGLPGRDYFLTDKYKTILEAYKVFMTDIAKFLGGNETRVEQDVEDMLEFETYMANVSSYK